MPSWASDPSRWQPMIGTAATGPSPSRASSASEPQPSQSEPQTNKTPSDPSEESGHDGLATTSCGCARSLVQLLGRYPLPSLSATMPTFDQVLSTNRSTMHVIGDMLSCKVGHADSSSSLMTACVLLQSILTSTHELWWSDCKLVHHQGLGSSSSDNSTMAAAAAAVRGEGIKQKVSIGGFMVSDEDSRILRQQMICLDLQKVKQLLDQIQDKLLQQPKCTAAAQERYPAGDIGHLVGTLLRSQLERLLDRTSQRPIT